MPNAAEIREMKPTRSENMKKAALTKSNATSARTKGTGSSKQSISALRYVTVDDVIKELLDLFERLGLDAGHLINRVRAMDISGRPMRRPHPQVSAISDLLTLWHQDPSFLNSAGNPKPVKMSGRRGSFREIAEKSVPNMPPTQLLRELQRLRAVRVDKKGLIHVRMRSLSIYEDKRLAALHTLNLLRGFINTLRHNLESPPSNADQLFHRIAWNGEFDMEKIPRLKIWLRRHGQSVLESADMWMMNQSNVGGLRRPKKRVQASVGLYLAVDAP
jgi:uncharacterized protein DUF6502